MSNTLGDGTVIPHFLNTTGRGAITNSGHLNDVALRLGEVKEIVFPNNNKSLSKKFIEYNVSVKHKDGDSVYTVTTYVGCVVNNLFGGAADKVTYTLRPDASNNSSSPELGIGSKVILLCINGDRNKAIIVGGIRDTTSNGSESDGKADGHNYFFEFNGAQTFINDDGELSIVFHGKTDADGSLASSADPDAEGSTFKLTKDGSIHLFTQDEKEAIEISHPDKRIYTTSENGVYIGKATDEMMLGTTYRTAEHAMNKTLKEKFKELQSKLNDASLNLSMVSALHGLLPVTGPMIVAGNVGSAAGSLGQAASLAGDIADALDKFEKDEEKYLSKVNKND
jgi:hypothetical protein